MGLTFALALLVAVLAGIFRAEYDACMPWIAERLRRRALKAFKGTLRERLDEEWLSHLMDVPSPMLKVWHGIGFNVAAGKVWIYSRRVKLVMALLGYTSRISVNVGKRIAIAGAWLERVGGGGLPKGVLRVVFGRPALILLGVSLRAEFTRISLIEDDHTRDRVMHKFREMLESMTGDHPSDVHDVHDNREETASGPWS